MAVPQVPITTANIAGVLERNFAKVVLIAASKRKSFIDRIWNVDRADTKTVRNPVFSAYTTFTSLGDNETITYDSFQQSYVRVYTVVRYAKGVEVTWEAREYDLSGLVERVGVRATALTNMAFYTVERDVFDQFNNLAASTTNGATYIYSGTSYPLVATNHPLDTGGTWSNKFTTPMPLSQIALESMFTHWGQNQVDLRGNYAEGFMDLTARFILSGMANKMRLRRLLGTINKAPESANHDINPVFAEGDHLTGIATNWIPSDGRWFAVAPPGQNHLNMLWRVKPEPFKVPDTQNGNLRHVVHYAFTSGADSPLGTFGSV